MSIFTLFIIFTLCTGVSLIYMNKDNETAKAKGLSIPTQTLVTVLFTRIFILTGVCAAITWVMTFISQLFT